MQLARTAWISAALALSACTMPDMDSFRAPDVSIFRPSAVSALREAPVRPVTAEDLVDSEGRCAGGVTSADASEQSAQASVPLIPNAVALDMTECDVVRRAGQAEKVALGSNERGERTATLTYIHGPRPGIYHFVGGRLASMERAPEPPAPTKPARKPAAKPKRSAT